MRTLAGFLLIVSSVAVLGAHTADDLWVVVPLRGRANGEAGVRAVSLSADARLAAFTTETAFAPGDVNSKGDVYVLDVSSGRVTLESGDDVVHGPSGFPSLSADGAFLAFEAASGTGSEQIFVRDRRTGTTRQITIGWRGAPTDGASRTPVLSAGGRAVAFQSAATNLVAARDANGAGRDVYVADLASATIERVSVTDEDIHLPTGGSFAPSPSGDGQLIAFVSTADLECRGAVCGQPTSGGSRPSQVYVRDRARRTTRCVSCGGKKRANGAAYAPVMSADGRLVAFTSKATNLVDSDENDAPDVFVVELDGNRRELISRTPNGRVGNGDSFAPAVSADGRFVAFESRASNLLCDRRRCNETQVDVNLVSDIYILDRAGGAMQCVSRGPGDEPWWDPSSAAALDATGRVVAFLSHRPTDVSDRGNDFDLYVRLSSPPAR